MTSGRTYYCSSPALDWRLTGNTAIEGSLQPDPLIYSSKEAMEQLYKHVDTEKGLGMPPPRPKMIKKIEKVDHSAIKTSAINRADLVKGRATSQPTAALSLKSPGRPPVLTKKSHLAPDATIILPSSSEKRKRDSKEAPITSTRGKLKQKWTDWEDRILREAIVFAGEKVVDWRAIHDQINKGRQPEESRTAMSIRMHYNQIIKGKMTQP